MVVPVVACLGTTEVLLVPVSPVKEMTEEVGEARRPLAVAVVVLVQSGEQRAATVKGRMVVLVRPRP
mgnify:CR=1 FL=1